LAETHTLRFAMGLASNKVLKRRVKRAENAVGYFSSNHATFFG